MVARRDDHLAHQTEVKCLYRAPKWICHSFEAVSVVRCRAAERGGPHGLSSQAPGQE